MLQSDLTLANSHSGRSYHVRHSQSSALSVASATNATNAANIAITDTPTLDGNFHPLFVAASTGNQPARVDAGGLTYAPNTNTLTVANLVGNATTATSATTATTATHLAGGAAGRVPFQTASGQTSFTGTGAAGQVLTSTGTGATWATPAFLTASRGSFTITTTAASIAWTSADQGGGWIAGGGSSQIFTPAGAGSAYYLFDLSFSTSAAATIVAELQISGTVVGAFTTAPAAATAHRFMAMRNIGPDVPIEIRVRATASATVQSVGFGNGLESCFLQVVRLT